MTKIETTKLLRLVGRIEGQKEEFSREWDRMLKEQARQLMAEHMKDFAKMVLMYKITERKPCRVRISAVS